MRLDQKDVKPEEKQFRLVKFFAYTGFIVMIIFSFPFSIIISQQTKNMLLESYENYALLLGENLNHQIFQNFAIPVIKRFGRITLSKQWQYKWVDEIVTNTIHGFNIEQVNIIDIEKNVIAYSTNSAIIGKQSSQTMYYKKAVRGKYQSRLFSSRSGFKIPLIDTLRSDKKLTTYLPLSGVNPVTGERGINPFTGKKSETLGVLELTQNITKEYRSVIKFQYLIFGLSIFIMGLIFIVLLVIVRKAEKIINKRAHKQRDLEIQLHKTKHLAMLGQMVAGVSHEIRNPLGIIKSTAELLSSMPDTSASQKKLSDVITEETTRLNNIVTEFLDFARPQHPNLQECLLNEIIRKNLLFLDLELKKTKITVRDNLNDHNFKVMADPEMLYRAFLNILINSIQSSQEGDVITVELKGTKTDYLIRIKDTGYGIKEEHLAKVLDPFFSTRNKGTGLGLSIVKKTIEGHGGSIQIKSVKGNASENERSGTTVTIRLPKT
jgi:signal transduction histidine kinase